MQTITRAWPTNDFGARFYDPRYGRFLSLDPLILDPLDLDVQNPYAYAKWCPLTYVDVGGLHKKSWAVSFGLAWGDPGMTGEGLNVSMDIQLGSMLQARFQLYAGSDDNFAWVPGSVLPFIRIDREQRLDVLQAGLAGFSVALDLSGAGALVSAAPDVANAGIYYMRDDPSSAKSSLIAAVPWVGTLKYLRGTGKALRGFDQAARGVAAPSNPGLESRPGLDILLTQRS